MSASLIEKLVAVGATLADYRAIAGSFLGKAKAIITDRNGALHFVPGEDASDPFNRLRISNPYPLLQVKHNYDKQPYLMLETITGAATSTHSTATASVTMSVTANGQAVTRQSRYYIDYQAGRGRTAFLTCLFGAGVANTIKEVGIGDTANGLFFQLSGTTFQIVVRSSATGSLVDTATAKASWNIDPLNGTGPSGLTLDLTKVQLCVIDYAWLGVGRVRFGFQIGGKIIYVHEVNTANTGTLVYMSTGALPVRYNISSTGGASSLVHICSAVFSDAGSKQLGLVGAFCTAATFSFSAASGTRIPLVSLKLKTAYARAQLIVENINISTSTGDAKVEIFVASLTSWNTWLSGGSGAFTACTTASESNELRTTAGALPSDAKLIGVGFVSSTQKTFVISPSAEDVIISSSIAADPDVLVVCATGIGGASVQKGVAIQFREVY